MFPHIHPNLFPRFSNNEPTPSSTSLDASPQFTTSFPPMPPLFGVPPFVPPPSPPLQFMWVLLSFQFKIVLLSSAFRFKSSFILEKRERSDVPHFLRNLFYTLLPFGPVKASTFFLQKLPSISKNVTVFYSISHRHGPLRLMDVQSYNGSKFVSICRFCHLLMSLFQLLLQHPWQKPPRDQPCIIVCISSKTFGCLVTWQ